MTKEQGYQEAIKRIKIEKIEKTGKIKFDELSLNKLPDELIELPDLKEISFSINQIQEIEILKKLTKLETISAMFNKISNLTPIQGLISLRELNFYNNTISDISILNKLENLFLIQFSKNKLTNIPNLENLKKLRIIFLAENKISEATFLNSIPSIFIASLNNNRISEIPNLNRIDDEIYIDLRKNHIQNIPLRYIKNPNLTLNITEDDIKYSEFPFESSTLFLKDNLLDTETIKAIESGGREGLLKYLESKEKGTLKIQEAKLMLLGMPRAGKSSLKKYLLREPFDPNEKSTEKIDLADWKEDDYTFHIWDFGGQEMLYDLHRFFLTDDALYVIVLDASKDEQPDKYLEFLESYAPKAPFYILINKSDIPTSSSKIENYNQIKDRYPNTFKGVFDRVSLMQAHENNPHYRPIAEDVRNKILDSLKSLPHVSIERPKSYQRVKEEVEAYYEKENLPYINSSTYSALCQEVEVNDEDRSILAFLNVLGTVRYINEPNIRNLHIINPEWAIEAAYFLLTNEEIKNKKGVLNLTQLEILLRSKADSKFTYEIFEIDYLLELLTKFRIIHFHNLSKTIYLPTHLGNDQPKQFKDFRDKAYHYFFEFKADIPGYVISALIAAKFDEIQDHLYWNKGAMLQKDNIKILFEQADKRKIDFWIQGEFFQNYFVEIRTILQEILKPLVGLSFEEKISVTDKSKTIEVKRTHLEKTLKRGREDYEDLDEDIIVNAREVLGTYFTKTEIRNLTQNFHGPTNFYNSDTINFWGTEWGRTFANIEDSDLKDDLINNLDDFEKAPEQEKRSLVKKIGDGIKGILTTAKDETTKEAVKELIPKIGKKLGNWSQEVDFNQLGELLK